MKNVLLYTSLAMILVSYLSSLNAFRLDMAKPFKQFSYFLLFVFICEAFGIAWPRWLYKLGDFPRENQWFYNLFHFATYCFYLFFFYRLLQMPKTKKAIFILGISYVLFASLNYVFFQGAFFLNTYTLMYSSSLMVFASLSYYYQLLRSKEVIRLKYDTGFWISTGILLFHLTSVMDHFLINIMGQLSKEKALIALYIIRFSALIMYLTFSIAFLCRKKT
jgi:hypothetical protein